ncbi:uncharacterized protein MYCFIDRAFT_180495 [Pseudocercospora fijiensis CIRAD86]|uniref:Ubiquitin-like protease family profile domain-containing protein n=1 Tax=Pseudocercospora fijiensis (strain CIRAD86) TaxID=383855 RepID=M3AHL7_PSEFD|nr:uncharacterized protein MYCFIDRAFT_180495 [Pseudocercospora fijiensis CIRAD86]EME77007.1 hypothetical protein MYCFIDRAFT_180495 [Pseudocercospora fijiensis CIRAD86]
MSNERTAQRIVSVLRQWMTLACKCINADIGRPTLLHNPFHWSSSQAHSTNSISLCPGLLVEASHQVTGLSILSFSHWQFSLGEHSAKRAGSTYVAPCAPRMSGNYCRPSYFPGLTTPSVEEKNCAPLAWLVTACLAFRNRPLAPDAIGCSSRSHGSRLSKRSTSGNMGKISGLTDIVKILGPVYNCWMIRRSLRQIYQCFFSSPNPTAWSTRQRCAMNAGREGTAPNRCLERCSYPNISSAYKAWRTRNAIQYRMLQVLHTVDTRTIRTVDVHELVQLQYRSRSRASWVDVCFFGPDPTFFPHPRTFSSRMKLLHLHLHFPLNAPQPSRRQPYAARESIMEAPKSPTATSNLFQNATIAEIYAARESIMETPKSTPAASKLLQNDTMTPWKVEEFMAVTASPYQRPVGNTAECMAQSLQPGMCAVYIAMCAFNPSPPHFRVYESGFLGPTWDFTRYRSTLLKYSRHYCPMLNDGYWTIAMIDSSAATYEIYDPLGKQPIDNGVTAPRLSVLVPSADLRQRNSHDCGIFIWRPCPSSIIPDVWRRTLISYLIGLASSSSLPCCPDNIFQRLRAVFDIQCTLGREGHLALDAPCEADNLSRLRECLLLLEAEYQIILELFGQRAKYPITSTRAWNVVEPYEQNAETQLAKEVARIGLQLVASAPYCLLPEEYILIPHFGDVVRSRRPADSAILVRDTAAAMAEYRQTGRHWIERTNANTGESPTASSAQLGVKYGCSKPNIPVTAAMVVHSGWRGRQKLQGRARHANLTIAVNPETTKRSWCDDHKLPSLKADRHWVCGLAYQVEERVQTRSESRALRTHHGMNFCFVLFGLRSGESSSIVPSIVGSYLYCIGLPIFARPNELPNSLAMCCTSASFYPNKLRPGSGCISPHDYGMIISQAPPVRWPQSNSRLSRYLLLQLEVIVAARTAEHPSDPESLRSCAGEDCSSRARFARLGMECEMLGLDVERRYIKSSGGMECEMFWRVARVKKFRKPASPGVTSLRSARKLSCMTDSVYRYDGSSEILRLSLCHNHDCGDGDASRAKKPPKTVVLELQDLSSEAECSRSDISLPRITYDETTANSHKAGAPITTTLSRSRSTISEQKIAAEHHQRMKLVGKMFESMLWKLEDKPGWYRSMQMLPDKMSNAYHSSMPAATVLSRGLHSDGS